MSFFDLLSLATWIRMAPRSHDELNTDTAVFLFS